jgi:hypothetical protein
MALPGCGFQRRNRHPALSPTVSISAFVRLKVDGEGVGDLGGEAIRDRFVEARTIGVHGQGGAPAGPIRFFLPALFGDFRHRHFGEPVRSLHIARNDRGGGMTEKPKRDPGASERLPGCAPMFAVFIV